MTVVAAHASSSEPPLVKVSCKKQRLRVILSAMIGNGLEWYDFALYGYFATLIADLFFPSANPTASLLATYGTFAAGFIMRPLGGIIFGHIGDSSSRKKALQWSIYLMAVPTAAIGFLPTYDQVGWLAPLLLTLVRLLQGLSMGGEFTGSIIFIVEHAEPGKRGLSGSWAPLSAVLGLLIGSAVAAVLTATLSPDHLIAWGWRVPFMISIAGGVVGSYMRRMLSDPEAFKNIQAEQKTRRSPFARLLKEYKSALVTIFLIDLTVAVGFYIIVTFVVSYLESFVGFSRAQALWISTASMTAFAVTIPLVGWLIDRVGRKPVMVTAALSFVFLSIPLFKGLQSHCLSTALYCHITFGIMMGGYFAPIAAVLVEAFPASVRYSGISIAHNLSMALFGGTAPFVVTWLMKVSGNLLMPAFYLCLAGLGSLVGLWMMKDRYQEDLDETHQGVSLEHPLA
jgi:MHS family proline/betaine transporter-like MFS transporter